MDIPFALKFLNKIDLFQVILKLNKQFDKQLKEITDGGTIPLWEAEKKILYWTYKNHKHLGSPLKIDNFRIKKEYLLKFLNTSDKGYKEAREKIKKIDSEELECNFQGIFKDVMSNAENVEEIYNKTKYIGEAIHIMGFTTYEVKAIKGIRKVFGNIVSRGYAKFWSKTLNSDETTQYNCNGIIITQEGLLVGELLNDLYDLKYIQDDSLNDILKIYQKRTDTKQYLKKSKFFFSFYRFFIFVSYLALFLVIILIFKEILELFKILP